MTAQHDLVRPLDAPRAIGLIVSAAGVDELLSQLVLLLARGDPSSTVVAPGCRDNLRRAAEFWAAGIHHLDLGTSGGVAGLVSGYSLMVGGVSDAGPAPLREAKLHRYQLSLPEFDVDVCLRFALGRPVKAFMNDGHPIS